MESNYLLALQLTRFSVTIKPLKATIKGNDDLLQSSSNKWGKDTQFIRFLSSV